MNFKSKTLSDSDRREFISAAVKAATKETSKKLAAARLTLEKQLRNAAIPADIRRKMKGIPPQYLANTRWSNCRIKTVYAGQHNQIDIRDELAIGIPEKPGAIMIERDTPLARSFDRWEAIEKEHSELSGNTRSAVRNIIFSIRTSKQLYDQWPNAKKVLPQLFSPIAPTTAVIPADAKAKADALLGFKGNKAAAA